MTTAQAIYDILTDVYGQSPWTLEQISADLDKPESQYFYRYEGQELVGFLAVQLLVGELEITNIAVKRAYQGRGLADQLMQALAKERQPIFLEVRSSNQAAQALYLKHGFSAVGRRKNYYHQPTEDAIIMTRQQ
ncbi:ribosomal protein S18-alanine N-acetyltransferase [Streptococcus entericus]|uniref:ribosomal protein S18-alanine N-acetyltransferase n=1 Tax=Streptococcus entericus TaxID=155680 RepID=UPI0003690B88|nr:ribosomal protein S18-alanine N-acetyltransferase [Streptococcus entericus]